MNIADKFRKAADAMDGGASQPSTEDLRNRTEQQRRKTIAEMEVRLRKIDSDVRALEAVIEEREEEASELIDLGREEEGLRALQAVSKKHDRLQMLREEHSYIEMLRDELKYSTSLESVHVSVGEYLKLQGSLEQAAIGLSPSLLAQQLHDMREAHRTALQTTRYLPSSESLGPEPIDERARKKYRQLLATRDARVAKREAGAQRRGEQRTPSLDQQSVNTDVLLQDAQTRLERLKTGGGQ